MMAQAALALPPRARRSSYDAVLAVAPEYAAAIRKVRTLEN